MSDGTFSKDQVASLEKILGVKLPEQGFTLEIKPIVSGLDASQLDGVVGGSGAQGGSQLPGPVSVPGPVSANPGPLQVPIIRWSAKI